LKAVILAAGEGTRLEPFTYSEPKVMIPVANRPILEYVVEALVESGIRDIVLVVGYRKERIMTHFEEGRSFGAGIQYVVQSKQLGTAHALLQAKEYLDDEFLVLPGDNVIDSHTVRDLLEEGEVPSMVITESEMPSKYGVVTLEDGKVQSIVEKPEERISNLINTGIYLLDEDFLVLCEELVGHGVYDIPRILQEMARQGRLRAITTHGTWIDVVYPWDIIQVNATALASLEEQVAGKVEEGVVLRGPVSIGRGSVIRAGSYILGPTVIGEGCEIGPHVTIYPSTSIGRNVTIGPSSVVEESLIMHDCSLGPFSYISHSVLGKGVRTGSHFSAFSEAASVQVEGEWHALQRVGSFLGEDTSIGSGVRALPGSIVGARCKAASATVLRGNISHGSTVV
jgi:glucose-1-phosphate thymidylyltransferase